MIWGDIKNDVKTSHFSTSSKELFKFSSKFWQLENESKRTATFWFLLAQLLRLKKKRFVAKATLWKFPSYKLVKMIIQLLVLDLLIVF